MTIQWMMNKLSRKCHLFVVRDGALAYQALCGRRRNALDEKMEGDVEGRRVCEKCSDTMQTFIDGRGTIPQ